MISFCCDIWGIIVIIYILFFVEQDTNKRSITLAKFRIDLKLSHNFFLSHWHRMSVPRPSVVLSHISTKSQQRMSTSSNILDQLVTWLFVIKRFLAICREREMVRTIFSWGFIWDCVNHSCLVHTQHAYIQTCFSDNEFVVCHVCKMSSHNWHCHVSFACLLSYAILSLIIHHWTCDKYLFILIYGVV